MRKGGHPSSSRRSDSVAEHAPYFINSKVVLDFVLD